MAFLKALFALTVLVCNIHWWQVTGKNLHSNVSAHHQHDQERDCTNDNRFCDCTNFTDADTLVYSTGNLYVAQPVTKRILIVNPMRYGLEIVKTIDVPGSECGGNCHPFGIAIHSGYNLLAIAAQSRLSGGESKVMMFKINGNLSEPSGISIEHYYTFPQLLTPTGMRNPDVRGVVFCGQRFAYADYNGVIRNFRLPDRLYHGWNNGRPVPDSRLDWYLNRVRDELHGHQYYIGCSVNGSYFVIERTQNGSYENAVGVVPSDFDRSSVNILDDATIWAKPSNWSDPIWIRKSRMNRLKGIAMDALGHLFYSSEKFHSNGASGVYVRFVDGVPKPIYEWDSNVKIYGMAVDERLFLYWVQQDPSKSKCLYKYNYSDLLLDRGYPIG